MKGYNTETTYYRVHKELWDVVRSQPFISQYQNIVGLILEQEPRTKSDLFSIAESYGLNHSAVDKTLAELVRYKIVESYTVRSIQPKTIRGKMIVDPITGTMSFIPDDAIEPLLTVHNVDMENIDFTGSNDTSYDPIQVTKVPAQHTEPVKQVYHIDVPQKPAQDNICMYCGKPLTGHVCKVKLPNGKTESAHTDCVDAVLERSRLFGTKAPEVIV